MLLGGLGPLLATLLLMSGTRSVDLRRDYWRRLIDARLFSLPYLLATFLIVPAATVLAIWISGHLGGSRDQWHIAADAISQLPLLS